MEKDIVLRLKQSRKYKYLSEDTLERIARWAMERYPEKQAEKAAKTKLHQIYGAYFEKMSLKKIEKHLAAFTPETSEDIARQIMEYHASTSERLEITDTLYHDIFKHTGIPGKIIDCACGLNPFSLPWMGLSPNTEYIALDIDNRLTGIIQNFFQLMNRPGRAACQDILCTPPTEKADMVLLLKTLPCLEQQERGVGERLLQSLNTDVTVISFPGLSLTGKERGMKAYYHDYIAGICRRLGWNFRHIEYPNELFYLVEKP